MVSDVCVLEREKEREREWVCERELIEGTSRRCLRGVYDMSSVVRQQGGRRMG